MRRKDDKFWNKVFVIIRIVIIAVLLIGLIATEIYVWVVYGNVSVSELPTWVIFFMFGGKR